MGVLGGVSKPLDSSTSCFSSLLERYCSLKQQTQLRAIELGCGASATALWLATSGGFDVTAVDISEHALSRARLMPESDKVKWAKRDILSDDMQVLGEFDTYWPDSIFCHSKVGISIQLYNMALLLRPAGLQY